MGSCPSLYYKLLVIFSPSVDGWQGPRCGSLSRPAGRRTVPCPISYQLLLLFFALAAYHHCPACCSHCCDQDQDPHHDRCVIAGLDAASAAAGYGRSAASAAAARGVSAAAVCRLLGVGECDGVGSGQLHCGHVAVLGDADLHAELLLARVIGDAVERVLVLCSCACREHFAHGVLERLLLRSAKICFLIGDRREVDRSVRLGGTGRYGRSRRIPDPECKSAVGQCAVLVVLLPILWYPAFFEGSKRRCATIISCTFLAAVLYCHRRYYMGQKEKLIKKLKSKPHDFTFE